MTPTLENKLALLATLAEETVEEQRLNDPKDIDRELEFALDDAEIQTWLIEKRKIGAVRYKRPAFKTGS